MAARKNRAEVPSLSRTFMSGRSTDEIRLPCCLAQRDVRRLERRLCTA
ncbi:MAG: hypothetical protein OXH65_06515 [Paracoccaceae bacterium]|nr:hypothetical protein [Paracoccaceae bacterium]MDE2674746.1 hypothetical protein [Paracoccaceae bacterium]MDE2738205.1 hypothetical protein [Paracoccaceae bacterium]